MEKKKLGQKEIVKLSIELLDRVETVEEIEKMCIRDRSRSGKINERIRRKEK